MNQLKELLDREAYRIEAGPDALESMLRRRDRKRRNQRIAAGVVGIVVFIVAISIVTNGLSLDRSDSSVVSAADGTAPGMKARSAGAIDEGFRGWYRVRESQSCPFGGDSFEDRVKVRYVSERVREITHAGLVWNLLIRYVGGEGFPWQSMDGRRWELRYDPATDTAVGVRHGPLGCVGVRFIPID